MNIRYRVTLTENEREQLQTLVSGGKGAVRRIKRAQILLAADARSTNQAIAINIGAGTSTVYRTKQRFVEEGLEQALSESPRPGVPRKPDASDESLLIAVACSRPPGGRAKWTMQLLADEMVRLTVHDSLSDETIRRRMAEMPLKPWQERMWCIPEINAEYVARMKDVLQLYAEIPDPRRPVVCFDETPRQLIGEARVPIPAEPGKPRRVDYEYVRGADPGAGAVSSGLWYRDSGAAARLVAERQEIGPSFIASMSRWKRAPAVPSRARSFAGALDASARWVWSTSACGGTKLGRHRRPGAKSPNHPRSTEGPGAQTPFHQRTFRLRPWRHLRSA